MKLNNIEQLLQRNDASFFSKALGYRSQLAGSKLSSSKNQKQTPEPNAETDQAREERRCKAREQTAQHKNPTDDNQTGTQKKRGGRRPGQRPRRANQQTPPPAQATCAANSHLGKPKHPARKHMCRRNKTRQREGGAGQA